MYDSDATVVLVNDVNGEYAIDVNIYNISLEPAHICAIIHNKETWK